MSVVSAGTAKSCSIVDEEVLPFGAKVVGRSNIYSVVAAYGI